MLRQIAKAVLPPNSARRSAAKIVARRLGIMPPAYIDGRYQEWIVGAEPLYWTPVRRLSYRPLISIIVPVFNVSESYLRQTVFSVVNQTYDNWELILVNASTDQVCREYTKACLEIDTRIREVEVTQNLGIGGNTNKGLEAAEGEYIALLDHDDTLAQQALYEVACTLQGESKPGFIYSDEDKLTADSTYRYEPHVKSDWSPHLFRQVNYLNHFTVVEKALADKVGGYRKGYDGAQDYDFYLRIIDLHPEVRHIPKILYHWRAARTSTAADFSTKKNVLEAGVKALAEHLERNHLSGKVSSLEKQPGYYSVQYTRQAETKPIAVVLLPSESAHQYAEYARQVVQMLAGHHKNIQVFTNNLKANQKYLASHEQMLRNIEAEDRTEFLRQVCDKSGAQSFILLDAAVSWNDASWISELAGYIEQCEDVALITPLLMDKTETNIVDAGYVRNGESIVPLFKGYPVGAHTFFGSTVWTRSVDVVSGRVVALSRNTLERYFMNDETTETICRRIVADGKEVLVYPQVTLKYIGDFNAQRHTAPKYSPMLDTIYTEFGFPAVMFSNPSGADNA